MNPFWSHLSLMLTRWLRLGLLDNFRKKTGHQKDQVVRGLEISHSPTDFKKGEERRIWRWSTIKTIEQQGSDGFLDYGIHGSTGRLVYQRGHGWMPVFLLYCIPCSIHFLIWLFIWMLYNILYNKRDNVSKLFPWVLWASWQIIKSKE